MAIAAEPARRWLERAMTYVRLACLAVERAGLDLLEITRRSIGVQAFLRPYPVEHIGRNLATYLRQPGPDQALVAVGSAVAQGSWPWR